MDITEFITARLNDEGLSARIISEGGYQPQQWIVQEDVNDQWPPEIIALDRLVTETNADEPERSRVAIAYNGRNEALHIARYDPARILREIHAKQQILLEHRSSEGDDPVCERCVFHRAVARCRPVPFPCHTVRLLAAPYSDHADFEPAWARDLEGLPRTQAPE